jgi:hypothetical protein
MSTLTPQTRPPSPLTDTPIRPRTWSFVLVVTLATLACGLVSALAAAFGLLGIAGALALGLFAVAAMRPVAAVYLYMATLPFLAGIDRDALLPLVRPNEALLALLVAGVVLGTYFRYVRGDEVDVRIGPLDGPLALFTLLSTLWPVSWLLLRGFQPSIDDLTALLPICKLICLLVLVRATVRSEDQVLRLARVITWPAAVIAVIAVLQTFGFGPILLLLSTYWHAEQSVEELAERGGTTFASSIATGDYVVLALALLLALAVRGLIGRVELSLVGLLLGAGTLAAGQFSTWAAAAVVGAALLYQYPLLRAQAVRLLPLLGLAAVIGLPALITRLSEFGDGFGVPRSWLGRWDNLVNFYLPGLGDTGWLLGVGPNSVLQAPETWREVIYLEYGYLQFLWVGGLPLLGAFIWLSVRVLRHSRLVAARQDAVGAYASALWAAWLMVLVLSLIDIHLVLRGAGELLFVGLAIVSGRATDDR